MRKISFLVFGLLLLCNSALAQKSEITVSEGISGDVDSKRRGPVLSTSFEFNENLQQTKILADAYLPNGQFVQYHIRFDFYINRELFASQIRAVEQPGPVGIDVPFSKATPPFDYSVVATLLHPNRQFTTTFYGKADLQSLIPTPTPGGSGISLNCTLTQTTNPGAANEDTKDYAATAVTITTAGESYSFQFTGTDSVSGGTAAVSGSITADSTDNTIGSGSITVTPQDGTPTTAQVDGDLGYNTDNVLNEIGVSSSDDNISLECCDSTGACAAAGVFQ